MSERYIQYVADNIYQSCITLFEERVVDDKLKQILLKQLKDYFEMTPKDLNYIRSLQFMYENWAKTIPPKPQEEQSTTKKVVYFYKPRGECFPLKPPALKVDEQALKEDSS